MDSPKNLDRQDSKERISTSLRGDEVVISGMSGVFPNSDSVSEFMDNLYNKVDMVSDNPRWQSTDKDLPKHLGRIKSIEKFDAQFFKVGYQLASILEPMAMKLLEHAYGAIFDSGTNLTSLKGKKVGVFIGSSFTDASAMHMFGAAKRSDSIVNGCSKAMLANRVSYWMDGKGPSYGLDYACASSTACLEKAYRSMKSGECDAAVVGGCNLCINPTLSINMRKAGLLCLDGKTKCFDKNGDGYVRSDAVSLLFLQRAKDAKRIYAEVYHAKGTYRMRPDAAFLPLREPDDIREFLEEFYSETDVDPRDVEYIEANGSGIAKADRNEIEAISSVFANDKSVKIGSVKSNMGHSDPASGVCALTKAAIYDLKILDEETNKKQTTLYINESFSKICLAYHHGIIPANLHYSEPQNDIVAVRDGRIQVLTEHTPFNRTYTALNNFSYTGANYHVLLKGHYKQKTPKQYKNEIPYIVLASGRQEDAVNEILERLKCQPMDSEQVALLHNIFVYDILGHTGRGYTILDKNESNETVCLKQSVDYYPGIKRPLWFVFSGMGSQWAGMGADLMRLPTFAAAIEKCRKVLEPKGMDIVKIVTDPDNAIFDNILNSMVGIGAVQIGLTDILKEMGIVPDNIIGHSLGEMACSYYDETLTAEELILATYCRGKVCLETPLIKGSMAAIGLGYKDIVSQCPPEIDIACHNSCESTTVSGPADAMKEFVSDLTKRGIFAKNIPCANIAYHSRYIAQTGPELLKGLKEVIKNPKPRSSKWLSTSIPKDKWEEPIAKYSSAEYHANNLLSPVLFEDAIKHIPSNAIVIEIAPHGLLQAILKRSHMECTHIPLTKRGNKDGVQFLLEAIGKMYEAGLNPKVDVLYPKIEFPVSTETPLLSHFVEWEHSENWPQLNCDTSDRMVATARNYVMSVNDDDYKYLEGHVRDGVNVLPEAAILVLVWETLAMYRGKDYRYLSVLFRDIQFYSEVKIRSEVPLRLSIMINKGNNKFEVCHDDTRIASGVLRDESEILKFYHDIDESDYSKDEIILTSEDIYKILKTRGFTYKDQFKSIHSSNLDCDKAYVKWTNEWVTFLDSLIQLTTLAREYDGVSKPKLIRSIRISVLEQENANQVLVNGVNCYKAQLNNTYGVVRCAGVEIDNITYVDNPILEQEPDVIRTKTFFPYYPMEALNLVSALHVVLQMMAENATKKDIKVTILFDSNIPELFNEIKRVADISVTSDLCVNSVQLNNEAIDSLVARNEASKKTNVFAVENMIEDEKKMNRLQRAISKDTFILALEQRVPKIQAITKKHFTIITAVSDGKQILILLKKANLNQDVTYIPITHDNKLSWISRVYAELKTTKRVVLISERQPYCGIFGLVKKLRNDGANKISAVITDDFHAPYFNPENNIYKEQLEKELAVNILKKGQWGGYYYLPAAKCCNFRNVTLTCSAPGNLDRLTWVEAPTMSASKTLVQVCYSGLSFKDIQKAVGIGISNDKTFGIDFSGIDRNGDRVMGVVSGGALSSTVEADPDLMWPVPEHWSLEDAATVPLPYIHAYYCLALKGELFRGQTVLVTGGAGALGQAVISVCLALDCTVYTTVSDMDKKNYLMKLFPSLNEKNIGNFRHESLHDLVMFNSKMKGCDFVINCASGSLREAAMKCVRFNGIFLDISKYDMNENKNVGMYYLGGNRSYKAVDLSNIFRPENKEDKKVLQRAISEGILKGIVRPLSRLVYGLTDVSRAFRLLSVSKQRGRVVVKMRDPVTTTQGLSVLPRLTYSSKGVYIVVCDDSDLGADLVDRMVKRGAKKIMIHLKSNYLSGFLHSKLISWSKQNVTIKLSSEQLQTEQGCIKMLKDGNKIGPIKGIFIIQNTDGQKEAKNDGNGQEEFAEKFDTISLVVSNVDIQSRNFCSELSHFVILSRYSQCDSDEYATSVIEKICQTRDDVGAPALILRFGTFDSLRESFSRLEKKVLPQTSTTLFNAMENSLKLEHKNVHTFDYKKQASSDFLKTISKILGVTALNDVEMNVAIENLKISEMNLEEIKTVIRNTYQIDYPIEKIQHMTINSLQEIGRNCATQNTKFRSGLEVFYTFIDDETDHVFTPHPVVLMTTLLHNDTETNIDPQGTYLTMIPGFEGRHQVFTSVAERLKIKAVSVQLGPDLTHDRIHLIAADVRKFMETKFEVKSKFYILGYSFGVNIALELAALLEKEGHVGVVFCLDSSPDALRVQMNACLGNLTETQLQNNILEHIFNLMTGRKSNELHQNLENAEHWSRKVDACLKQLKGLVNYSTQYSRSILESAYRQIRLAQDYEPDFTLESELVLMKGIPHPKAAGLDDDYNLSKYTKRPVKVFNLESDHGLAPYDSRVSNIINRLLEPRVLEEYKNKNLCETYLTQSK